MSGYPNYKPPHSSPPITTRPPPRSSSENFPAPPDYAAPPGWQPPRYSSPPHNPFETQNSGGGNGCALAAIIVFIVVGLPIILGCGVVGYLFLSLKSSAEREQAKRVLEQEVKEGKEAPRKQPVPVTLPRTPKPPLKEEPKIASAQDAVDALRSSDWQRQRQGAEWLVSHPVDESQRIAAAAALEKGLNSFFRDVADNSLKGLALYGSPENAAAVAKAINDHRVDRKLAIEQLGKWKEPSSAQTLVDLLDDSGPDGEAAAAALALFGPEAGPAVSTRLDPNRPLASARAEKLLSGYGIDTADAQITARLAVLKSKDRTRKREAARALAAMPLKPERQAEVARALDAALNEGDRSLRDEALNALAVWADKESVSSLVKVVKGDRIVNKTAVALLARHPDPLAKEALVSLLDNSIVDDDELSKALTAYGADIEPEMLQSLHDPRRRAKTRARTVLTALGTQPDALLTQTLLDVASSDSDRARSALDWLSTAAIDPARKGEVGVQLLAAAKSSNSFVQGAAVEALIKLDDPASYAAIGELVKNPISQGRVMLALNKAGPAAEDLLLALLKNNEPNVAVFACFSLQRHGTAKSLKPLQEAIRKGTVTKNQQLLFAARTAHDAIERRNNKK